MALLAFSTGGLRQRIGQHGGERLVSDGNVHAPTPSNRSDPAISASVRNFAACAAYSGFNSTPSYRRPMRSACQPVDPIPLNGSSTTSPGLL